MEFADIIKSFFPKSTELHSIFASNIKKIEVTKGQHIINIGDTTAYMYYLQSGIMKAYFTDSQHKRITVWFSCEGEFLTSMEPYSSGRPSKIAIEALENGILYAMEKKFVNSMRKKYAEVNEIYAENMEKYFMRFEKLVIQLKSLSAMERYKEFEANYPALFHRVLLGDIASYLNITPSTLSKLRSPKHHYTKPKE